MELAVLNSPRPLTEPSSSVNDPTASWKSTDHITMGLRSEVHLEDSNCQASWRRNRRNRRMGMDHNVPNDAVGGSSALNSNSLKSFLSRAAGEPDILGEGSSTDFLAQEIGVRIFRFMMKSEEDIELGMTMSQIGMDSLMAIELKRWWKQAFGLDISVLEIMGSGTLEELGKVAAQNLKKKFAAGS